MVCLLINLIIWTLFYLNFLFFIANILGVQEGCRIWWEFPSEFGFMPLDLNTNLGLGDPMIMTPALLEQLDNENNMEM